MAANISPRSGTPDSLAANSETNVPAPRATAKGMNVAWAHIVLGALGLAASAYAVHVHVLVKAGEATGCGISETISCDQVIGSKYGEFFGIPLGIFGALFWAIVLLTAVSSRITPARTAALQRLAVGTVGLATSLVLAYISLGVIHKVCLVCATTHILSGINFLFALWGVWKLRALTSTPTP